MTTAFANRAVAELFDAAAPSYDRQSNAYTLGRRAAALAALVQGRCVDLGGGTGAVLARLRDRSTALHADIAPGMCRVARGRLGCATVCCDAEAIPLADDSFDTVVSAEMIYYLKHPQRFLREAHRILRPGGRLLLSTTNPWMTWLDRGRSLLRRLGLSGMFFDDGSPSFIPLRRLRQMLHESGLRLESAKRIVVLPFACCDRLNRVLEHSGLNHFGLFLIVAARKV
ncbi:MAG: methyltransferase domain-containing protein [Planctomycetes bacterium]|nr:methyltransferase domain-containing protein [Planctomycetota bacterium]